MYPLGFRNKKDERKKKDFFLKNGAAVLEKLIRLHNGDCNLIRSYSAQQLHNATGNFRWEIHEDWNYKLYKGFHEDREISVKKFKSRKEDQLQGIANEVAIASRMSNHNNVLKLLGCCLETELPLLVYEFPVLGNLGSTIYRPIDNQLPRELRLRMVTGIANAVAYLHHGLSKMIIHRDIKPRNIFLDEGHTAKLFEFQEAIPIPEGETHVDVETIYGTYGFLAPEVAVHMRHTEKSDVYAFGVLLFEVLTGKKFNELLLWQREIFNNKSSDMRVQSYNICSQQGETREPVSSSVQPNDSSEEIIHECSDIFPQEEAKRAPLNSSDLMKGNIYGRVIEHYCEIYPRKKTERKYRNM